MLPGNLSSTARGINTIMEDFQHYDKLESVHSPDCKMSAVSDIAAALLYRSDAFPYISPTARQHHEAQL